jgi:tRNA pseudouridine55 synthase
MLTRDAKERGAKPGKVGSKRGIKVGHGGTLDPLATGVLVIGVGKGTKQLQRYEACLVVVFFCFGEMFVF